MFQHHLFSKYYFRNNIGASNSLDPDQAQILLIWVKTVRKSYSRQRVNCNSLWLDARSCTNDLGFYTCIYDIWLDARSCDSNPCENGGTCTNGLGFYTCECEEGWTGKNCETGKQIDILDVFIYVICLTVKCTCFLILGRHIPRNFVCKCNLS